MPTRPPSRKALIVLGMHRSGTSALSGSISQLGFALPNNLIPGDQNNRRGYYESGTFGVINDDIFAEMGTAWDDWTPVAIDQLAPEVRTRFLRRMQDTLRQEYPQDNSPVLIKDPRICRLLPLWLEAMAELRWEPHCVFTFRNPHEVSASLQRRDGFSLGFGLLLWLHYTLDAEYFSRDIPRRFTNYDQLMKEGTELVHTLCHQLQLSPEKPSDTWAEHGNFLAPKLRHFDLGPAQDLHPWWHDCLTILERWVAHGERTSDHSKLDKIRQSLNGLPPALTMLVRPGQQAMRDLAALQPMQAKQTENLHQLTQQLAEAQNDQAALQTKWKAEQTKREVLTQQLAEAQGDQAALQTKWQAEQTKREVLQTQLNHVQRSAAQTNEKLLLRSKRAEHALVSLQESTSWRITRPLRKISARLRRTVAPQD